MPMMQQPGYPQQMMQGSPPPGYVQQQQPQYGQPQQGYGQPSQMAQNQPAIQAGRSYSSNDRLPAIPDMIRRPTKPPATDSRQPLVRGAAPEQALTQAPRAPASSSPGWTPIHIPTPVEMGIAPIEQANSTPVSTITVPDRYDLGTVTTWLDRLGARSCNREKLAEGVQFVCSFGATTPAITVRGNTDEEALRKLVQEVIRRQQGLSQR